jgi:hypothetical protein
MFFYQNTASTQESGHCFGSNATSMAHSVSYYFTTQTTLSDPDLHTKVDRMLSLLEGQQQDAGSKLAGTMSTQEAADFVAISKRTFERKVQQGLISPIAKHKKKNQFSKQAVLEFFIAYRGYQPAQLP